MKFNTTVLRAMVAAALLAAGNSLIQAGDDTCAERTSDRSHRCIFPLFCDSGEECDCDRSCCPDCGRKKPREKKQLLSCFACKEPPRGATAVSLPARLAGFANADASGDTESARFRNRRNTAGNPDLPSAAGVADGVLGGGRTEVRLSRLESDLNSLTVLVEKLAESQSRQERDLTNNTLLLERIADQIKGSSASQDQALPPAQGNSGENVTPPAGSGGPQGADY